MTSEPPSQERRDSSTERPPATPNEIPSMKTETSNVPNQSTPAYSVPVSGTESPTERPPVTPNELDLQTPSALSGAPMTSITPCLSCGRPSTKPKSGTPPALFLAMPTSVPSGMPTSKLSGMPSSFSDLPTSLFPNLPASVLRDFSSSVSPASTAPGTPRKGSQSPRTPDTPGSVTPPPSRRPSYVEVEGVLEPWACDVDHVMYAIMYRPYPGDVFVASYPCCGGRWIAYLLYMLTNDGEEPSSQNQLVQEIPLLEYVGRKAEKTAPPRKLKTHLPASRMRLSPAAKYVYAIRNYKDCCVSLYGHMVRRASDYRFNDGTFEDYFESFLAGTVEDNDYFDHINSWWRHRNESNYFFLHVENLKQNFERVIIQLAEFLEGPAALLVQDRVKLDRLVSRGTFNCFKKDQSYAVSYLRDVDCFLNCLNCVDGYWRKHLTEEQSRRLDEKFSERTKGTTLELLFLARVSKT
ncbi:sulfotransferase 1B1-like [Ornithodoros turicata]|uniref:sulfotransferase 1B1-like n=1 Tax=Ornithodoros turicata TaxID=34597 RepID=UPI003138A69A